LPERHGAEFLAAVAVLVLYEVPPGRDDKAAGKELIEKAGKVSNIRAEGAPSFAWKAHSGSFPRKSRKEGEGT
jgi:hypothetical protein